VPLAFDSFGDTLLAAFQKRPDLQTAICSLFTRISSQTAAALRSFNEGEGAAAAPALRSTGILMQDEEDSAQALVAFTREIAEANAECLRQLTATWMPELLNRYVGSPPEERGPLNEALEALAAVVGERWLVAYFKTALVKVVDALKASQVRLAHRSHSKPSAKLPKGRERTRQFFRFAFMFFTRYTRKVVGKSGGPWDGTLPKVWS
jgi:hypothetical protein